MVRRWLVRRPHLQQLNQWVLGVLPSDPGALLPWTATNLTYNCAIARCLYRSIYVPLPDPEDVEGMAAYHVRWYNNGGKATVEHSVERYNTLVLGK